MTVKEYLEQYRELEAGITAKLEQAERLRALVTRANAGIKSGGFSPTPYDKVGEITAKIVDLENEINGDIDRLIDLRTEIRGYIALIPNAAARSVIELRYLNGCPFEKIAERKTQSIRSIYRLHEKGLEVLEKMVKKIKKE